MDIFIYVKKSAQYLLLCCNQFVFWSIQYKGLILQEDSILNLVSNFKYQTEHICWTYAKTELFDCDILSSPMPHTKSLLHPCVVAQV